MQWKFTNFTNCLIKFTALKNTLYIEPKDTVETLERSLNQSKYGQIEKLFIKGKMIQERLFTDNSMNQSSDRKATLFTKFIGYWTVNKTLKLWDSLNKPEILTLTEENFEVVLEKRPKAYKPSNEILIQEELQNIHPVIYDSRHSGMVRDAIKKTCGWLFGFRCWWLVSGFHLVELLNTKREFEKCNRRHDLTAMSG